MASLICKLDDDCEKLLVCKMELDCVKTLQFETEVVLNFALGFIIVLHCRLFFCLRLFVCILH